MNQNTKYSTTLSYVRAIYIEYQFLHEFLPIAKIDVVNHKVKIDKIEEIVAGFPILSTAIEINHKI